MAATRVVRLYKPSTARPMCAHWSPAAILDGLTLCGLPTHGLAGRTPEEQETARRLRTCADCQQVADRAKRRYRTGHTALIPAAADPAPSTSPTPRPQE